MKCVLAALAALLLLGALAACVQLWRNSGDAPVLPRPEGALRIATHNVHYIRLNAPEGDWSVADWERRKHALDAAFKALDADLVAFQEWRASPAAM